MRRIKVENLSIRFVYPMDRTKNLKAKTKSFVKRVVTGKKPRYFFAISNVNLSVSEGDIVGIIGPNGSGKTTLLRAISGIYKPDNGSVTINGRISSLLSLGTGFDNNLSGLDNIYLNGLVLGMTNREIKAAIPEIIEFAEIGDHIYSPMKYYSNGMISRLSFSILLALRPDILLIDEVFSVGDLAFQKKSQRAMRDLLSKASCQLIVTHALNLVENHCNRAVYIKNGKIVRDGKPDEVIKLYVNHSRNPENH